MEKKTCVFIPVSDMKFAPFGYGNRQCYGKTIASVFLLHFFKKVKTNSIKYEPEVNHLYSGRNNDDKLSFNESIYQLKTLTEVLFFDNKCCLETQKLQ